MLEKIKEKISNLPGFDVLSIAFKEINLIKTQKIALALILLYPIIVIATLGTAFSGTTGIKTANVVFYAPENLQGFDIDDFLGKLEGSDRVNLIIKDSASEVEEAIRKREAKLGLIFHEPEPTHGRFVVDLLLDNSDIISSEFFFQIANDSVRRVGFETSREFLVEIWENLSRIKTDLKEETKRVDSFLIELETSETELLDLNASVNALDIDEMKEKLATQSASLDGLNPKIESFEAKIEDFTGRTSSNLDSIRFAKNRVINYKEESAYYRDRLQGSNDFCIENDNLVAETEFVKDACDEIITAYNSLDSAQADLAQVDEDLGGAEEDLEKVDADLQEAAADLREIKEGFANANQDLNFFNAELSKLGETVDKVNILIVDSLENKARIKADLEESKTLMNGFISKLDELQGLSPQFLANPIIINKISIYNANKLEIITPMALVLVLLLTTILLTGVSFVVERNEGAYSRLLLSSTSKIKLFSGKIFGQMLFALLESAIIIAIAILAFNIKIAGNFLEALIGISIIAFSFISLGLFISNYTKIQSTTILAGLLLVIPMIFISGIMIPVELMSEPIQALGSVQPLTMGVQLATEILLKGTSLLDMIGQIATLLVPALIFFGFTLANKNLN